MDSRIKADLLKAARLSKSDKDRDVLALEEHKERTNPRLSEYFAENQHEYVHQVARAALSAAWADAVKTDIINKVIQTKTVPSTQAVDKIEDDRRGTQATWHGVGGEMDSAPVREQAIEFSGEAIQFAHDYHVKDLETNFWGTYADLVSHGRSKMDGLPVTRLIQLINDEVNSGTNSTQYLSTSATGVQDTTIDPLINGVSAKSQRVSILGSRNALTPLEKIGADFSDNLGERYFMTGKIGVYKAIPLVEVDNYEDAFGSLILPDDELWIVGENAGRLTWFGSNVRTRQHQLPGFMNRLEVEREAGMRLWGGDRGRLGRIVWS